MQIWSKARLPFWIRVSIPPFSTSEARSPRQYSVLMLPQRLSNSGSRFLKEYGYNRRVPTKRFPRNNVFKNIWHIFFRNCVEIEIQGYIIIFSSLKTWCLRDVGDPSHVNHVRVALRYVNKVICKTISNNDHIDHSPSHFHLYSDWWDYSQ